MITIPNFNGLSLFSGIGGIDLAFNWAGGNILAFCEIDPFCQNVLHKHWPYIHIFGDIHKLSKEVLVNAGITSTVDVIYGGFPCQPFSVAGNKKGKNDTRYLWPEFSRLVSELRPRWVIAENVPGILRIAADDVCSDLERQGYEVGIWDYEAAAVGAKHRRERVFFVAHAGRSLLQRSVKQTTLRDEAQEGTAGQSERPSCTHAPYTDCERRKEQWLSISLQETHVISGRCGWRQSEPELGGGSHGFPTELDSNISPTAKGIPNRTNRLKALGNAVVPQQVYPIFKAIMEVDKYD